MRWEWKERPMHLPAGPEFASRAARSGGDSTPPNSILNAVGLKVWQRSMSSPRTKAQGWLFLAKSDTKDMEQDHFWMCGEHDITCRKWKKGPPKNATVTAVAGNGARWKREDDEKNESKKPNEGTKVVPMTGVEEQPEDTEETGQQSADGRNKETSTPVPAKIQQHEQYEHHRLIDPESNGGACGFEPLR